MLVLISFHLIVRIFQKECTFWSLNQILKVSDMKKLLLPISFAYILSLPFFSQKSTCQHPCPFPDSLQQNILTHKHKACKARQGKKAQVVYHTGPNQHLIDSIKQEKLINKK